MQKEVGKKMNDQIKTIFREFDRVEYKKREERRAVLTSSLRDSRYFSIGLSIFIMCISLMSAIYITHIISKRIKQMVNLANDIAQGHFKNISDHKNDELSQLSTSLNIMSNKLDKNFTELERKNEELDQFAYVVSHDLKAPLRGIYNIISWIEEDLQEQLTKELRKYFSLIKGRLSRLENLINGLLEFARIGREERKLEMVGVQLLLEEVIDLVVPPHYKVEIPDNLPVFYTERLRLQQVFSNLITNAVRHSGTENQKITIGYKEEDDFFCFWVQDFGKGIAPEFQHKIFQIFQTLREKDGLESTGLGLSIVKKIVEDQKGEIRLYSQPGKGAMFTFTWPKIPVKPFENAIG